MIRQIRSPHRTSARRGGMLSMELVLTLPLLLILLLGIFEFSFLMYARGDVVQASRAGARLATLNGVWPEEVESEVARALGDRFKQAFKVETQMGEFSGDEVIVTVRVPMTAAAPNLLWPMGYNIVGRDLIASTRMVKE
ncbi:TadE/TadG family type IV pilus assembly protein [Planctomicrobium piriforme]|uniref:TadE-like protein n=1 Tax=Planctomicrobium piriforme TaxID=1576369 RepID=A0A1I3P5A6_9PLAN|nr:TadE/TadG family type IV pilus assembly protein [Planctomicrobium piriforme]SFJ16592.1 TadE-like protein [Planctomicrobium piriforme]